MERRELLKLAELALRLPTAPYREREASEFVVTYCRNLGLRVEKDRTGNLIVKYQRPQAGRSRQQGRTRPPLVFVAHMDHPGFEMLGRNRAEFLGGVPKEMFARGVGVRVYGSDGVRRMKIARLVASAWPKHKLITLSDEGEGVNRVRRGDLGMWDLPAFRVANGKLHAAAIDDILGTVVLLATLAEISRQRLQAQVWCAFTRAEEVGFQGALALVRGKKIPRNAVVISIEMSNERPWARIGNGPVVRVGDRSTIFYPATTAFLLRAAERCREKEPEFRVQRCLMDGGTCEATAFAGFGYRAGGLCLPLGNYHNIGKSLRPRAEFVSISDLEQLLKLTVAAAGEWPDFGSTGAAIKRRLLKISQSAPRPLKI
jgi:putative aminopeptidase FrvX